jgi:hypothetical protein
MHCCTVKYKVLVEALKSVAVDDHTTSCKYLTKDSSFHYMIPCITRTSISSRGLRQLSRAVSRSQRSHHLQVGHCYISFQPIRKSYHSRMSLAPRSPVGSQPGSGRSTPGATAEEANGYLLLTIQGVTANQIYAGEASTLAKGEMRYVLSIRDELPNTDIPPDWNACLYPSQLKSGSKRLIHSLPLLTIQKSRHMISGWS